jgi:signal peptidase II
MHKQPQTAYIYLFAAALFIFVADQSIKIFLLQKAQHMYMLPRAALYDKILDLYETGIVNIRLVFNHGVAFSMFSFLHGTLKWLQLALLGAILLYVIRFSKRCFFLPVGIMLGAGFSNIFDRFIHGGVVDYIYWHLWFHFAIFNFADVMIDIAVAWIVLLNLRPSFCAESSDTPQTHVS